MLLLALCLPASLAMGGDREIASLSTRKTPVSSSQDKAGIVDKAGSAEPDARKAAPAPKGVSGPGPELKEKKTTVLEEEKQGLKSGPGKNYGGPEETVPRPVSSLLNIGGYADAEYHLTSEKGKSNGFRLHHLSIFLSKDIQKQWKFFSEIEYEDAVQIDSGTSSDANNSTVKTAQGNLFVEQMYIDYQSSRKWNLGIGRFLTPWGIWGMHNYTPNTPTQRTPLTYDVVFPVFLDGVLFKKEFGYRGRDYATHFYYVNGSNNPGSGDRNQNKGIGLRVETDISDLVDKFDGLIVGGSFFRETNNDEIKTNAFALHALARVNEETTVQAEYALRRNGQAGSAKAYFDKGLYIQVLHERDKWTFVGRYDTYDPNDNITRNDHDRYTIGANYHFAENVVGKAEINKNLFDSLSQPDFFEIVISVAVSLGGT